MLTQSQRAYLAIEAALRAGGLEAVLAAFGDTPWFPNVRDPRGQGSMDGRTMRSPPKAGKASTV